MNELVTRIATQAGIDPALAEKAGGMILGFLQREGQEGPVADMIKQIPGAAELIAQFNGAETQPAASSGGLMGSLMGAVASLAGGQTGDIMALGQKLMAEGMTMDQIKASAQEIIAVAKQYAGEETFDRVVKQIPGLSMVL